MFNDIVFLSFIVLIAGYFFLYVYLRYSHFTERRNFTCQNLGERLNKTKSCSRMRYSVLFYTLMILAIISWLHQRSLASLLDIDLYRSWTGQKLIDQRNIREKAFWVRQQVNNLYQCMRWCWFFKACTVLTYTLDQQWCSLYKEKYTRISRHGLGNLHFIPNDNSIVVAMEGAAFSKKKVKDWA